MGLLISTAWPADPINADRAQRQEPPDDESPVAASDL